MRAALILLVVATAAAGLAGCGSGGSTTARTKTTPTSAQTTHTVATPPTSIAEPQSPVAGVEVIASTLQLDLQRLGYHSGSVDGEFTDDTKQALQRFQVEAEVASGEHGALGPGTAAALSDRLAGSTDVVTALQSALTDVGLFHATINGRYDDATVTAVKALQSQAKLTADGLYGRRTASALASLYSHDDPEPIAADNPSSTTTTSAATTTTSEESGLLKLGSTGAAVKRLQERLTALGYRPGAADGNFGVATASAVLAFQKREGLERDSVVGPGVQATLAHPQAAGPPGGPIPRLDVDIARQLVFVVLKPGTVITLNSSTGNGERYSVPGGGTDVAYTPVGHFTVIRKVPGDEHAPLGTLRNPLYFYKGWAIHGAANVPAYPASHGCARISNDDADWLFPQVAIGTPVIVYDASGKSPNVSDAPVGAAPGY